MPKPEKSAIKCGYFTLIQKVRKQRKWELIFKPVQGDKICIPLTTDNRKLLALYMMQNPDRILSIAELTEFLEKNPKQRKNLSTSVVNFRKFLEKYIQTDVIVGIPGHNGGYVFFSRPSQRELEKAEQVAA